MSSKRKNSIKSVSPTRTCVSFRCVIVEQISRLCPVSFRLSVRAGTDRRSKMSQKQALYLFLVQLGFAGNFLCDTSVRCADVLHRCHHSKLRVVGSTRTCQNHCSQATAIITDRIVLDSICFARKFSIRQRTLQHCSLSTDSVPVSCASSLQQTRACGVNI